MQFKTLAVITVLLCGLPFPRAQAGFLWTTPWNVNAAPGSSITLGPDLTNGGSATGTGTANAVIQPDGSIAGLTSSSASFGRSFMLSGSPTGWTITITSSASGSTGGVHGSSTIQYSGYLDGPPLFQSFSSGSGSGGPNAYFFNYPNASTPLPLILQDGSHTISLSHFLSNSFPGPPFSGPGSVAGANINYNFQITATPLATAVPAPATWLLLGLGSFGVARRAAKHR